MHYGWNMMGGGFFGIGWIMIILFWIVVILGIVALIKWIVGSDKTDHSSQKPLEILKERYARGEIDKKEYQEMKKEIG